MIEFNEVYKEVEKSSHETAFNEGECRELYDLVLKLPEHANIVEIGVQYGRSLTVLGLVSKDKFAYTVTAIDNWSEPESREAKSHVEEFIKRLDLPVEMINTSSKVAEESWGGRQIHLIHIDGDHSYKGVFEDCENWLPHVAVGGYACFDDYRANYTPEVVQAVNDYMQKYRDNWIFIRVAGEKLAVFKRVK